MKLHPVVLSVVFVAFVAATASAALLTSGAPADQPAPAAAPPPSTSVAAATVRMPPPAPALEIRRAPVPMLHVARPAPAPFEIDEQTKPQEAPKGMTEAAAKAAIEADGYRSVRGLSKAADGRWAGRAMRGADEVAVIVAADGSVGAE